MDNIRTKDHNAGVEDLPATHQLWSASCKTKAGFFIALLTLCRWTTSTPERHWLDLNSRTLHNKGRKSRVGIPLRKKKTGFCRERRERRLKQYWMFYWEAACPLEERIVTPPPPPPLSPSPLSLPPPLSPEIYLTTWGGGGEGRIRDIFMTYRFMAWISRRISEFPQNQGLPWKPLGNYTSLLHMFHSTFQNAQRSNVVILSFKNITVKGIVSRSFYFFSWKKSVQPHS